MKKLFLFTAIIFGLVLTSCSDDDNEVTPMVTLEGNWRLVKIDFTVMGEGGFPASDACIQELVVGYEFREDHKFYFILGESDTPLFDPYARDYWTWSGNIEDFTINQTNPMSPPYNFSLNPTDIEVNAGGNKPVMTFNAELHNGSAAKFTLVKETIDKTKFPMVTDPNGDPYHCGFFD